MNRTKIEWCDRTWNPITGCTPASEGCENCYAKRIAETRLRGRFGYPEDNPFKPGVFHKDKLKEPTKIKKKSNIFVCSMGDIFHDEVDAIERDTVFEAMYQNMQHNYFILTKRPYLMKWYLENIRAPMDHVWYGVSIENQIRAQKRVSVLFDMPRPGELRDEKLEINKFISIEPLIGPLNFGLMMGVWGPGSWFLGGIDWVIVGAETGPGARPCKREWVEEIVKECQSVDAPVFLKDNLADLWDGELIQEFPEGLQS